MRLEIEGFRGFEHAVVLEIHPALTFLVGDNGAGKTTLLMALGAAAAMETTPLTGKIGADATLLVHRRPMFDAAGVLAGFKTAKKATVSLSDGDDFRRTIEWAGKTINVTGEKTMTLSLLALALRPFSTMPLPERYELLADALEAVPTVEELKAACPDASEQQLASITKLAEAGSWDDAFLVAAGAVTEAQGQWKAAVGKLYANAYSVGAANKYEPEGLTKNPAWRTREHLEELRGKVAAKREALKTMGRPVQESQLAPLRADAANLDKAKAALYRANKAMDAADTTKAAAVLAKSRAVVPGTPEPTCSCPSCGTVLVIVGTEVRLAEDAVDPEEQERIKLVYDKVVATNLRADTAYTEARALQDTAQAEVNRAEAAVRQLAQLTAATPEGTGGGDPVGTQAEIDLLVAEGTALGSWLNATEQHALAQSWTVIRDQLKPEGLRAAALRRKLAGFNERLAVIAKQMPGFLVRVEEDMSITTNYGEFITNCGGEAYMADVAIQITLAEINDDPLVLIDEVNKLTERHRDLLFEHVLVPVSQRRQIVVACAIDDPALVEEFGYNLPPDVGATFWVEKGTVRPLGEVLQAHRQAAA
jgi:energy-coupling factor transporter ATP-binding protein EcfA2